MNKILTKIREKLNINEFEDYVIDEILKAPYRLITDEQFKILFKDYQRGTFTLQERYDNPYFLFDEEQDFDKWLNGVIRAGKK